MEKFKIIRAEKEFLPYIAEIERQCFSIPRSEKSLLEDLESDNFSMFAAVTEDNKVIGWSGFSFMFDEAEVADIAVLKDFRGMGAGFALTKAILDKAKEKGLSSVILEVRRSNESAKKIYSALGFEEIAVRKNFYELPREDGISMKACLK